MTVAPLTSEKELHSLKNKRESNFDRRRLCTRQFYIIKNVIKGSKKRENIDQENFVMDSGNFLNSSNNIVVRIIYPKILV